MANTPEIYQFGDSNNPWPYLAMGNNGFGGLGGLGSGFLGGIFGGLLSNAFGWGGNWGNGGNGAAAALGAQAQNNNNTDLLMSAITSNGTQQTQAIQNLATMLGQDFNTMNTQIQGVTSILNQMAITNATTPLQIINAINSGNAAMAAQFAQCCCENRLQMCQQTNEIVGEIQKQTIAMNDQFCALKERELQQTINAKDDIIAQLRDQAQAASINGNIANLQAQITALAAAVAKIPTTTTTPASNG